MIIHVHCNMHHLIIVVGFGFVLKKSYMQGKYTLRLEFREHIIVQRGRESSLSHL